MKKPEQLPNKEHRQYIQNRAVSIWSKQFNLEGGKWFECIRLALKEHREYLAQCVEERVRIRREQDKHCEDCGTPLDQMDIYHYVSYCHNCFKVKYVDSVCIPHYKPPTKPRIATYTNKLPI